VSEPSDNLSGVKSIVLTVAIAGLVAALAGCVERRLIVRSDPTGAKVFLDGKPRGETPATIPFTYYGTREVVLRAPKHHVRRMTVELAAPWWQWTPIDFVTELLIPWTIEDERVVEAKLEPSKLVPAADQEALKRRSEERRRAEAEAGEGGAEKP
jgi:hypothetical protein